MWRCRANYFPNVAFPRNMPAISMSRCRVNYLPNVAFLLRKSAQCRVPTDPVTPLTKQLAADFYGQPNQPLGLEKLEADFRRKPNYWCQSNWLPILAWQLTISSGPTWYWVWVKPNYKRQSKCDCLLFWIKNCIIYDHFYLACLLFTSLCHLHFIGNILYNRLPTRSYLLTGWESSSGLFKPAVIEIWIRNLRCWMAVIGKILMILDGASSFGGIISIIIELIHFWGRYFARSDNCCCFGVYRKKIGCSKGF